MSPITPVRRILRTGVQRGPAASPIALYAAAQGRRHPAPGPGLVHSVTITGRGRPHRVRCAVAALGAAALLWSLSQKAGAGGAPS